MANSYTQIALETGAAEGAGIGQVVFPFTFEYLNTADIKVIIVIDPAAATPVWTAILPLNKTLGGAYDSNGVDAVNKKIVLNALPSATSDVDGDSEIRIYRSTTQDSLVDFQGGSRISEADLDTAYRQGLFAAQEVAENASTTGVAGAAASLTAGSVQLAHMDAESVDSAQYVDRSIDTAHIALDAVGEPELATVLNLSTHTVTLPNTSVTAAMLATSLDLSGKTLTLPQTNGQILDRVSAPADGNNQLTKHTGVGVWTWPTAAVQELTGTTADVVGSVVCYTPPTGTSRVEYEYNFTVARDGDTPSLGMFKLYLAASAAYGTPGSYTEVTNAKFTVGSANQYGTRAHFKWVFHIGNSFYGSGGGTDTAFGAVDTWGASRFIKIMGREFDSRAVKLNQMYFWDDTTPSTGSDTTAEWTSSTSYPVLTITSVK